MASRRVKLSVGGGHSVRVTGGDGFLADMKEGRGAVVSVGLGNKSHESIISERYSRSLEDEGMSDLPRVGRATAVIPLEGRIGQPTTVIGGGSASVIDQLL